MGSVKGGTRGEARSGAWTEYGIAALLALATVVWLLAFGPLIDAPVGDDSSFARSAEGFARTGRVVYNGWSAPMILPQSVYGGLLVRWFGFSFRLLQLSGVAVAAAAVAALYALARSCGVGRGAAVLACCVTAGCPAFVCVAPSFQTDLPGVLLLLGSQLFLVRALRRAGTDGGVSLAPWPFAGFVILTIVGGSERQIIWTCGLAALLPVAVAVRRDVRGLALLASGAAFILAAAALLMRWYAHQPDALPISYGSALAAFRAAPGPALLLCGRLLGVAGVLLLPMAVLCRWRSADGPKAPYPSAALPLVAFGALWAVLLWWFTRRLHWAYDDGSGQGAVIHWGVPVFGNYATSLGPFLGVAGATQEQSGFQMRWSLLLHAAGAAGMAALVAAVAADLRRAAGRVMTPATTARWALLTASLAQLALTVAWFALGTVFDRYLLLVVPGLLIFLAPNEASRTTAPPARRTALAWGLAALVLVSGVLYGQTYWSAMRAKTEAFRRLQAAGVDPRHIDAGPEFNIDTQIRAAGTVNVGGVRNPSRVYPPGAAGKGVFWLGGPFPEIDARYRLAVGPDVRGGAPVEPRPVFSVRYRTLLPPFERRVDAYRLREQDRGVIADGAGAATLR